MEITLILGLIIGVKGLDGNTLNLNINNHDINSVRDLWLRNDRKWDIDKVSLLYGKDWGDRICNLPIGNEDQCDRIVWFHNPHGCFTSKSAYSWLLLQEVGFGPHRFYWKAIWKLDTLPKIRVFAWRVGHEILPTKVKIASIRNDLNRGCPRCGATDETLLHALRDCHISYDVLSIGGWDMRVMTKHFDSCVDWLESMLRILDNRAMADLITIYGSVGTVETTLFSREKKTELNLYGIGPVA